MAIAHRVCKDFLFGLLPNYSSDSVPICKISNEESKRCRKTRKNHSSKQNKRWRKESCQEFHWPFSQIWDPLEAIIFTEEISQPKHEFVSNVQNVPNRDKKKWNEAGLWNNIQKNLQLRFQFELQKTHEALKNKIAGEFKYEIQNASNDTMVLTVDLQKVLETPSLTTNIAFYKRQLSMYNLCIANEIQKRSL